MADSITEGISSAWKALIDLLGGFFTGVLLIMLLLVVILVIYLLILNSNDRRRYYYDEYGQRYPYERGHDTVIIVDGHRKDIHEYEREKKQQNGDQKTGGNDAQNKN